MRLFFRPFLIVHLAQTSTWTAIWGLHLPNPTRFYDVTLNPKSASIPSHVFRKGMKKSVRFGSIFIFREGAMIGGIKPRPKKRTWKVALPGPRTNPISPMYLEEFFHFFSQGGDHIKKISHHPIVRLLKNRGIRILVDGHDEFRRAHSCKMLDRP